MLFVLMAIRLAVPTAKLVKLRALLRRPFDDGPAVGSCPQLFGDGSRRNLESTSRDRQEKRFARVQV
jgi:hypothetical protein